MLDIIRIGGVVVAFIVSWTFYIYNKKEDAIYFMLFAIFLYFWNGLGH